MPKRLSILISALILSGCNNIKEVSNAYKLGQGLIGITYVIGESGQNVLQLSQSSVEPKRGKNNAVQLFACRYADGTENTKPFQTCIDDHGEPFHNGEKLSFTVDSDGRAYAGCRTESPNVVIQAIDYCNYIGGTTVNKVLN